MQITINILLELFMKEHKDAALIGLGSRDAVTGIRLLPSDASMCSEKFLYVTDDPRTLERYSRLPIHLLCFSSEAAEFPGGICVYTQEDLSVCFNSMMEYLNFFSEWGKRMDFAVFEDDSLQTLIDLSSKVMHAPVLIYNPALKLLAHSKEYDHLQDQIYQTAVKSGYLDKSAILYFEQTGSFQHVNKQGSSEGKSDEFRQHNDFIKALPIEKKDSIYCIMLDVAEMSYEYTKEVFDIFCGYVQRLMEKKNYTFERDRSAADYFLMDLLDNPGLSEDTILERIQLYDLESHADYVLMNLHSSLRTRSNENYYIQMLRSNLINCRIFSYQENIVMLYPIPEEYKSQYREHIKKIMDPLLKELSRSHPALYISRVFSKISLFSMAYRQTEHTAAIADKTEDIYYFYEDVLLANLFYKKSHQELLFDYCDSAILDLYHQNTAKSRQSLRILYTYLRNDRKMTDSAMLLNMHRNNVIYHMKQMSEQYHLNLDDPDVRERLLISFHILSYIRRNENP